MRVITEKAGCTAVLSRTMHSKLQKSAADVLAAHQRRDAY